jgi:hypothetical protein
LTEKRAVPIHCQHNVQFQFTVNTTCMTHTTFTISLITLVKRTVISRMLIRSLKVFELRIVKLPSNYVPTGRAREYVHRTQTIVTVIPHDFPQLLMEILKYNFKPAQCHLYPHAFH